MLIDNGSPTEAGYEFIIDQLSELENCQTLYDLFDESFKEKRDREALFIWLYELIKIEKNNATPIAFEDKILYPFGKE